MADVQNPATFTSREQAAGTNLGTSVPNPGTENPFAEFVARYRHDPVGFVVNVLGATPDEHQAEVLEDVFVRGVRQISIRSGHGTGKSTTLAWIAVIACCLFSQAKVIQTAPSGPQLYDALFAETCMWFKRLPAPLDALFVIKQDRIEHAGMKDEVFVSARTSRAEAPEAMAGVHADAGIVILMPDEASGIPEAVFEAASGSMSGHNCHTILASNPTRTSGLFFDTHHKLRAKWKTYHWSCLKIARVSRDYIDEQMARFGEDSNAFRVRVLGEFPRQDDDVLISLEKVEAAVIRDISEDPEAEEVWGLDVARFGRDKSALCKRKGKVVLEKVKSWAGLDTMQLVGRVKAEYDAAKRKPVAINVDVIGIGSGVVDRLRELGLPVYGVNVAEAPSLAGLHTNLRAELWCALRDWIDALDCKLPDDPILTGELTIPRYKFASSGKIQIESKEDMHKRAKLSPDHAEALMLTFANDAVMASGSKNWMSNWNKPLRRRIKGVV